MVFSQFPSGKNSIFFGKLRIMTEKFLKHFLSAKFNFTMFAKRKFLPICLFREDATGIMFFTSGTGSSNKKM
jgi:hypothetical protein